MNYKLMLIVFIFVHLWATNQVENDYLSLLDNDNNWKLVERYDDGIRLYSKEIKRFNLRAYRVEKSTNAQKDALLSAFETVENYDKILTSAKNITFNTIEKSEQKVLAYQHINIPLISNRHYFYHMFISGDERDYAFWQLTEVKQDILNRVIDKHKLNNTPVKLKTGAGIYRVKESDNQTIAQYSLFLDPEGDLPAFLGNMANKSGLVNMFRDLLKYTEQEKY